MIYIKIDHLMIPYSTEKLQQYFLLI